MDLVKLDSLKTDKTLKWNYLGKLEKNNSSLQIPDYATEINVWLFDGYYEETNERLITTLIANASSEFISEMNLHSVGSILARVSVKNKIITMINVYDNNICKVYFR